MTVYTTTATATSATNNTITVASSDYMFPGLPISFSAPVFGGIIADATYYIGNIVVGFPTSTITVSAMPGGDPFVLSTATGSMTATFTDAGQRIVETVPPGEPLTDAFNAINLNFDQIFAAGPVGSNVQIDNTTISTIATNASLILAPNGTGNVISNVSIVPNSANTHNLGSATAPWSTVYTQDLTTNRASLSNVSIASANNITVAIANLHISGGTNGYVLQTDGAGDLSWTAMAGAGNGNPGGGNNQVQYNDDGVFAGSSSFEFDPATGVVNVDKLAVSGRILGDQVRIGSNTGNSGQGANAVAIGRNSGALNQGANAVAIGQLAGYGAQGRDAVAIGSGAGHVNQGNNSIVINATGGNLTSYEANTFVVAPIRNDTANTVNVLYYNTVTKEVTYGPGVGGGGNVPIHDGNVVDGQYYISTVPPGEPLNDAFNAINLNFDQIFTAGPVLSNIRIANNEITTLNTNGNLVLNPNGVGRVVANADVIPDQTRIRSLGSPTRQWDTVYAQYLEVSGNIAFANILVTGTISAAGNVYGANLLTTGNVSAVGNITGNYILGNGAFLTGVDTPTRIANGNSNVNVVSAGGNVTVGIGGVPNVAVFSNSGLAVQGTVSATGNVTGGNILFGNGIVSGTGNIYANKIFANIVGNIDAAGNLTEVQFNTTGDQLGASSAFTFNSGSNLLTVSGNVQSGNVLATGIVSAGGGVYGNIVGPIPASSKIIYVAKNGNDTNDGGLNAPFLTIKAAMAVATSGTSVHVAPGAYTEINPITIPTNVALMGDNLRSVFVTPATPASDLFYLRGGSYVWGITIRDYLANGFSYDPATPSQNVFVSPYVQNITSSTTTGTAVFVDGNATSAISTKAMILGFFTIINRGGRGVYLMNSAYSQAVNIYTIACDIGLKVESGAFMTLNGSDCSIGNFGLIADGVGPLQTTADVVTDFQGLFKLENLPVGNVAATQIQPGSTCTIVTQGTTDFVAIGAANNNPGTVFVANATGTGTGVVSTPTRPNVNTIMRITGDPENYTIGDIIPIPGEPANVLVQVQQIYLGNALPGTAVTFNVRSSIIASAHTFEYVGAGTNPATALPQYGGIPIEANEVIQTNGGVVTFTSTDQKGNFKVGSGFIVNQATSEITGDAFYRSLFSQMTPYILALSS